MNALLVFTLCLLCSASLQAAPREGKTQQPATPDQPGQSIPFEQLGAEAQKQYTGDGIGITATARGARLRAEMQDLEAEATAQGLWLKSVADEDMGKEVRFRVLASEVGREGGATRLPATGKVHATAQRVAFIRPGVLEEYSVSTDGVRQDFVVLERPAGTGSLVVQLGVAGARVEAASYGAKLILNGNQREIAYSRLRVTDATGRELTACMEVLSAERLTVRVEDDGAAYPVRIDPTFSDADWVSLNTGLRGTDASGQVVAMAVDGSGNIYIGGSFFLAGSTLANQVAKWNGSSWSALGTGLTSGVFALAARGTDLYAGGSFTTAGGVACNCIAKWDGTAWSPLGSGLSGLPDYPPYVSEMAVMGTDIYVGGRFSMAGGVAASGIAKWNGSTWSALGAGVTRATFPPYVSALVVSGSDLFVGGLFTAAGGVANTKNIAKWNGTTWSALGSGMNTEVKALAASGANLYAGGGGFTIAGFGTDIAVARWDGSTWSGVGSWEYGSSVSSLAMYGSILYAGGDFLTAGGVAAIKIAKWNGTAWSALGSGFHPSRGSVECLKVAGSDLFVGGSFGEAGGVLVSNVVKWNIGTSTWSVVGPTTGMSVYPSRSQGRVSALLVSGTDLYVGGQFTSIGGVANTENIAKWNGSTWSALGMGLTSNQSSSVGALAMSGSNLYAGGTFTTSGALTVNNIAKWDGSSWSALGSGITAGLAALAVSGTDVYAGGSFTTAGGVAVNRIAKWNGTAWSALGTGVSDTVRAMAVSGTSVYAGGGGSGTNGAYVWRWNGSTWFNVGSDSSNSYYSVDALAVHGADLYVGGNFNSMGVAYTRGIAKWDGSTWSALGTGMSGSVHALAVSGTDLYAAGSFSSAGGVLNTKSIAKWNGTAWSALGSGVGVTGGYAMAVAVDSARHLYVGGNFLSAGSTFSPYLAQGNLPANNPDLTLTAVTGLGTTGATLNGTVNPNGLATTAQFEYGLTTSYGSTASVTLSPNNGSTAQGVSAVISGLTPNTTYHYRLAGSNVDGPAATADNTFTTSGPPAVTLAAATGITASGATLNGTVDPKGLATTAQFEYGLTTSYGSTASVTLSPNNGTAAQNVSAALSGLIPGMTYHYRLTATNSQGTSVTTDGSFTTPSPPTLTLPGSPPHRGGDLCQRCGRHFYRHGQRRAGWCADPDGVCHQRQHLSAGRHDRECLRHGQQQPNDDGQLYHPGAGHHATNRVGDAHRNLCVHDQPQRHYGYPPMSFSLDAVGVVSTNAPLDAFTVVPVGVHPLSYTATDAAGNTGSATCTVTVILTGPPTLNLPPAAGAEAIGPGGAQVFFNVTATSFTGTALTATATPPSGSFFPIGTSLVYVGATDSGGLGLSNGGSFFVTVQDTVAPAITPPANITVSTASPTGLVVNYPAATATDAVGVTSLNYSKASGTLFPPGVNTVTITAKDAQNNTRTATFTVTVNGPQQNFDNAMTSVGLSGSDAALDAIPHGDGVENLLKYAFNMDLSAADSATMPPSGNSGLPAITAQPNGVSSIFRYEFLRRKNSGLIYTPQKSAVLDDPMSWIPLTDTPTVIPIDATWERVIYEEPYNAATAPKCFGRVQVSLPP